MGRLWCDECRYEFNSSKGLKWCVASKMYVFWGFPMGNVQLSPERNSWRLPNNAEEHCRTAGGPSFSGRDPRRSGTGGAGCAGQHRECGFYYNPFIVAQFIYLFIYIYVKMSVIYIYVCVCVPMGYIYIYIHINIVCMYMLCSFLHIHMSVHVIYI